MNTAATIRGIWWEDYKMNTAATIKGTWWEDYLMNTAANIKWIWWKDYLMNTAATIKRIYWEDYWMNTAATINWLWREDYLRWSSYDNYKFFIIHCREKWYKQNMYNMFWENVFVCEDFLSTVKKTSYRK